MLYVVVNKTSYHFKGHDNTLIAYFVKYDDDDPHFSEHRESLPLSSMSENYVHLVAKRLSTQEGQYGIADLSNFRFTVQPPLDFYQSADADAPFTGQWIVKLNGFGSIFDPPLSQIEVRWLENDGSGTPLFVAQNLPDNLMLNTKNYDSVNRLLKDNKGPYFSLTSWSDIRHFNEFNIPGYAGDLKGIVIDNDESDDESDDYKIDNIQFKLYIRRTEGDPLYNRINGTPDLKALWHYTQPPRQGRTVNMAAVRRKDLLGLD